MTFVRKNALVSSGPMAAPSMTPLTPSLDTQLKAESAKQYLEAYFSKLFCDVNDREQRRKQFFTTHTAEEVDMYTELESSIARASRCKIRPDRFERISLIGQGGFGKVWLVYDKVDRELYALKILKKARIISTQQVTNVRTEREVLSLGDNPWMVKLHYSFQDDNNLYLVLDYVPGGDLMNALIKHQTFNESITRFICGELALAIHSVHSLDFVHLDLKPDNVLISDDGHIKLTDFGLATHYMKADASFQRLLTDIQDRILTSNGQKRHHRGVMATCDYAAPEVLQGKPATIAADWWSFGVIIFETLFGYTPFYSESPDETAMRILNWRRSLRIPTGGSTAAIDLLRHLLCDEKDRYGFEEVKNHPFFRGFNFNDWNQNPSPMVPVLRGPMDVSHFDVENLFDDEEDVLVPSADLARFAFLGFTYRQKPSAITVQQLNCF